MQKSLSLAAMYVVLATSQVYADTVKPSTTLPTNGTPEHVYTMVSGNDYYANGITAPTQTDTNYGKFAFYAAEGKSNTYYVYSLTEQKWLTYNRSSNYSNQTAFVKTGTTRDDNCYFLLNNYSGDYYEVQPYTTSGTASKYLNWYKGIGTDNPLDGTVTLGLWEENGAKDGGSRWSFAEIIQRDYTYTITINGGGKVTIGGTEYASGDTYHSSIALTKNDIVAPAVEGKFVVVSINDVTETVKISYADVPTQPATVAYQNASVYPAQQENVGNAVATEADGVYTFSNNVLAASFVKVDDALYFAGSEAMNLEPGTEPFTVALGGGLNVPASAMTLKSLELKDIAGDADAVGGAEHYNGKELVANYEYTYEDATLAIEWKAVLRDGSHYLRTEMKLVGNGDVKMYNVIPLIYNVNTKAAGSAPKVVGNTRGAILMSNKIFAGLENPVGYNTVGEAAADENAWTLADTKSASLTVNSWQTVPSSELPPRVTEATAATYPHVLAYKMTDVALQKNQKVVVTVKYTSGNHKLNLGGVDLLTETGEVAASDYHKGTTGDSHDNNVFTFYAPYDKTFTIRAFVEDQTETVTATSTITAEIYNAKEGTNVNTDIVAMQGLWSRKTTLKSGEDWKISGVVGLIAQDGTEADANIYNTQKRRSVLAYSERERAVPWRAFPAYISWYELNIDRNNAANPVNNMKADQVLDVVNHWKSSLWDKYNVAPNSFVIDDGWDKYGTWEFHEGFPNGLKDVSAITEQMGAGVGAWLGPVGGYGQSGEYRRNYWNQNNRGGMYLSNPAYYQTFLNAAQNLTQNNGDFRFFKFDGISDLASATGPKPGDKGNEDAEGIIRLERYVRENFKRDIFFNTTVGTWASPFWYHYTDATWRQVADYDEAGNNSIDRENWITYRDRLVYQNYVSASPVCPINTLMTHGFILSTHGAVSKNMDYNACLRELRCAFACGSGMVELYCDYERLDNINNGKLWGDIAECIAWQKKNADVLPDAHWVGGNPWDGSKTSVYGWAAWNGKKATLALRNGGNNQATYTFTLREALNVPANVNGSFVFNKSFNVQDALNGFAEGVAISFDEPLTVTLPGSSVFCFDGADAVVDALQEVNVDNENAGNARIEYFDLGGRKLSSAPTHGVFVKKSGNLVEKKAK